MVSSEAAQSRAPSAQSMTDDGPRVDVGLLRWPEEEARLERVRGAGSPRLLLMGGELAPPPSVDPLEDWIRLPAAEDDLRARVATLSARAGKTLVAPPADAAR